MNAVLDLRFGGSEPATLYLGLCTSVAADGTITGEHSGDAYERVEVPNNGTYWNPAGGGSKSNKLDFTFPPATGTGWGALDTAFLSASSTGGTALIYGTFTEKTISGGDTPYFEAGDLVITLTDV